MVNTDKKQRAHTSLLFFFLLVVYCLLAGIIDASEPVIKTIEVEGLMGLKEDEFINMVGLHVGERIDMRRLDRGIKRAFRKGIFLDIKALSEDYEDGVKLIYVVKELPIIKHIIIHGNKRLSRGDIKKVVLFKEGDRLREEFLPDAKSELISFYHRRGFIDARVEIKTIDEDKGVALFIDVNEGEPLIIRKITITPEVRNYIRLDEGDILDIDLIENDLKRIEEFYKERGYIKPVVGPYIFQDGELTIPVKPGERLEISIEGNEAISTKKLTELLTKQEYKEITADVTEEMINHIKRAYLAMGYHHVQVTAGTERDKDLIRLRFLVQEGKRVMLADIGFQGTAISVDTLKDVIPLRKGEPYNVTLIEDSISALKRFYNAMGYLYTEISDVKEYIDREGKEMRLEFIIKEGPRIKVESVNIIGNTRVDESTIRGLLKLREGDPYNAIDISDARYSVMSLYRNYGLLDADVEVESIIWEDKAYINLIINEGEISYTGKVIIRGNQKTKDKVIMREMALKEGEPYSYDELVRIRERLSKLGIFDEVSIDLVDPFEEDGKVIRDTLITIKEASAGTVDVAIGYSDYERLRGSLEIDYQNLGGYNRQIGLRVEMSNVQERYSLNFKDPWFFNKPNLPFNLSLINEKRRAINLDTKETLYKLRKLSLIAGTEREIRNKLKAGINYEYSSVKTTDVEPGVILTRDDTETVDISSISSSIFYDTRDNPFDPASGSLSGIVLKVASKALLSEAEFIKGIFQSSWYIGLKRGVVFAFSIKAGIAHSFGETKELPLIERFFLGGRTSVRGYSQDTLGPKGENDVPTGGNVFTLVNTEVRIPLKKGFGIATFVDAGNVWRSIDDFEPELRYTAGVGLRYRTPIGPLRIDYGYKLDRLPDESVGELHFSIGHAF